MSELLPFKIERYFARYEFTAEYLLCSSDCESMAIRDLLALEPRAADSFQNHWLGYTETQGASALRREICRIYTTIQPDQVMVHTGAEEGIFCFMQAALRAGDHLIVQSPCYQALSEVARSLGCEITFWRAAEANGWAFDPEDLRRAIRPNTRAVVINNPHNPTGHLMTRDELRTVDQIVQERDLILFSDEVYRECEYSMADRLPAGCDLNEKAVSLGVLSKTYGLPGLRIGWVATRNAELLARMTSVKDYTTICNSAPSEFLAELALRHRERIAQRNLDLVVNNLIILDAFFDRYSERFAWVRPKAGPIAFPRLVEDEVDSFCDRLVKQAGVLLLPGTVYDDPENHFRIGFGRKNLPEAVARLESFLQSS
ncbi:MAG TPA: aminotransferase class I/II-fold pyridoxal phosphate-dependent enzyme [Blastocatellia bacterium]|nr:aminotransferase class I/II-fold pyridoxal phosphate-dependent enzyme [Blastocatellia bacterium]